MLTAAEAARELGITPVAVRYRLEKGLMTGINYSGQMWLIPRAEVERVRTRPRYAKKWEPDGTSDESVPVDGGWSEEGDDDGNRDA